MLAHLLDLNTHAHTTLLCLMRFLLACLLTDQTNQTPTTEVSPRILQSLAEDRALRVLTDWELNKVRAFFVRLFHTSHKTNIY
jgi:hypothetical protein